VLYVTGCGGTAQNWMTKYSGSSNFALESTNFYAKGSLEALLGFRCEKYVNSEVAEVMAQEALLKAHYILKK
jgi:nicotinamide mononucleotide (NMN) deamidase PncC